MTTLADMILASPAHRGLLFVPVQTDEDDGGPPATIPVLVADNVAAFFFAGTTQEHFEFARDFPACALPVSPLFVEMARPPRVVSGVHGLTAAAHLPARWGWRFEATARDRLAAVLRHAERGPALERYYGSYLDALAASGRVDVAAVTAALDATDPLEAAGRLGGPDGGFFAAATIVRALDGLKAGENRVDLGWLLHGDLVVEHDGLVVGPVATLDLVLNGAGRPAPPPLIDAHGEGLAGAEAALLRATILPLTFPALMSLSFMNAEGVKLESVETSSEVARRHEELGLPAPAGYLILDISAAAGVDRN